MSDGERHDDLFPQVYAELRRLAAARLRHERPGQTLSATALVHEAYLRLFGSSQAFDSRGHFFAAAAEAMRRLLVEQARRRLTLKRGDGRREDVDVAEIASPEPDEELLALHEALEAFAGVHPEKAELVKLRYFAGMTADEAAEALGMSPSTADRAWAFARAWLNRRMRG